MRTLLVLTLLGSGCYFELDPVELVFDLAVPSPGQDLAGIDLNDDGPRCPGGTLPYHAGELADPPLERWGADALTPITADPPTTTVTLDPSRRVAGQGSLRLDTTNGQAGLFYPATRDANFDLRPYLYLSFLVTADNSAPASDPGWQGAQPRLLLVSGSEDYFEYVPMTGRLPRAPGPMVEITVPLDGGYGWQRNQFGAPDLSRVRYLALTFDSWGSGFTVWVDDLRFGPGELVDCAQ